MDRTTDTDAIDVGGVKQYTDGDPNAGQKATRVRAREKNLVQEELCDLIEHSSGGNATLNANDTTQVRTAVQTMIDASIAGINIPAGQAVKQSLIDSITSDETETSTTYTDTGLLIDITLNDSDNEIIIAPTLKFQALANEGSDFIGKAAARVQMSTDGGSTWADVAEYTESPPDKTALVPLAYSEVEKIGDALLSGTSWQLVTDMQVEHDLDDYTDVRLITFENFRWKTKDTSGGGTNALLRLQRRDYDGSVWGSWATKPSDWELMNQIAIGGVGPACTQMVDAQIIDDEALASNITKVEYRLETSTGENADKSEVFDGSKMRVWNCKNKLLLPLRIKEIGDLITKSPGTTTVKVKVQMKASESGNSAKLLSGSKLEVHELDD